MRNKSDKLMFVINVCDDRRSTSSPEVLPGPDRRFCFLSEHMLGECDVFRRVDEDLFTPVCV